jgi:RHH-type proline utilization regulon transcriptional repressor/proline dehydrogenase/delta 1-pyrroline-5-carboxylate dehydrogenase
MERTLLRGFQTFGGWLPGVSVPLVKDQMQQETANVVLPAESEVLTQHLAARAKDGVRMNLNFLGDAVMGEEESAHRLQKYLEALQLPEVEVISVKISTLYSQISALAREHTLRVICDRLELLYRQAARLHFTRPDGTRVPKFVYLDMEEYRDLQLTAQAFMRTLDRPGLKNITGGIALQAYVPDSAQVQRQINDWAKRRVAAGGAPITIRLVKGANMEAERVEASIRDWPQSPFKVKAETDANYKRMLHEAMKSENLAAVRVGVASHNLFDLAYGVVLATEAGAGNRVQFEMLEGMANHQRRALLEHTQNLLLYAPACRKEEFLNAIGYLIRRLDENTGPDNFLRHAFKLKVGSPDWENLARGFRTSFALQIADAPRRTQNRQTEHFAGAQSLPEMKWTHFVNEPDTDWSLPENSAWAEQLVAQTEPGITEIPLVIGGAEIQNPKSAIQNGVCLDPSRPGVVLCKFVQATEAEIDQAVACAKADPAGWRTMSVGARNEILGRVAQEIRRARGNLMWAAMANGGKTLSESDPEVSEAVDFLEFYRSNARYYFELPGMKASPRGVVAVIPPWNFPIAIPCGGIAAALAAGNTVILKPASDTVLIAWELCQCFWRAGVPKTALQFAPGPGSTSGQRLVTHPDVHAIILTGGTSTAVRMLKARPDVRLFAETGGKNATVVTALSDRELAIKHIVHSAFSHNGQKCSATSVLLLEAEVYDDPKFKAQLCDAVKSIAVGSAWELPSRMSPLIRPPGDDLENGLKTLESGETWAVVPRPIGNNPNLWSPGVKYGVRPGSYTHLTEFFGPVLGVMRFERLDEAIALVNATGYGLTSGLHSLDEREHAQWKAGVHAGNLYLNRGTVGAIVLRQPFGGVGRSSFGPGMKAGGPNYVAQFMKFEETSMTDPASHPLTNPHLELLRRELSDESFAQSASQTNEKDLAKTSRRLRQALESYDRWWIVEFSREHDHLRLLGQDNVRRYRPFGEVRVRVTEGDTLFEVFARVAAARATGARVIVSSLPANGKRNPTVDLLDACTHDWAAAIEFVEETDEQLAAHIRELPAHTDERIRFAASDRAPAALRDAATVSGAWLADEPVLAEGRVELLWYLREQSVSYDYHRYGNLGPRASEARHEPS